MTNDKARAALGDWIASTPLHLKPNGAMQQGFLACYDRLRATGQLCTVEERAVLEASGGVSLGALEAYLEIAGEHGSPRMAAWVKAELARRAKGGSDVG